MGTPKDYYALYQKHTYEHKRKCVSLTRAFDFTLTGVLIIISVVIHRMGAELFAPESPLHKIASKGTTLNGAQRADLWFEILTVWVPLLAIGFAFAYLLIREYRRQVTTAARQAP